MPVMREGSRSSAVFGLARTAIEHADLLVRDRLVEGERLRLKVAPWDMFGCKMPVVVLAAHQRRPIPLAHRLLQMCRDIADREPNAPIFGAVRLRTVEQQHVVKRGLAGLQFDKDRWQFQGE